MSRLIELRVRDVALLRESAVTMEDGFGVLTGESGSGKSLCVAALRFLLGGRADGELISRGAAAARITAVFEPSPHLADVLDRHSIAGDELLTLSREAVSGGRGTCRVNGALVSQTVLREIGEHLAEVTVQGASHRLLRRAAQRQILDAAGGDSLVSARTTMTRAYADWRRTENELADAVEASRRGAAELAEARALVGDLGPLGLVPGEEDGLAAEGMRLRHAARIRSAADGLAVGAAGAGDEGGAADLLAAAVADAESLGGVDQELRDLAAEAAGLSESLRELALSARRLASGVEIDDRRLADVEERLDVLARIRRRHGSIESAIDALERAQRLCDLCDDGTAVTRLESAAASARMAAGEAAAALSAARRTTAQHLEAAVEARLRPLELAHARFRIVVGRTGAADGVTLDGESVRCTGDGVDEIDFRLAANRGDVPLPLDEGPSGGELSRLALAIAAAAGERDQPLLVLDEVDTGIGGETAARVGDLLAEIGAGRQVLAITHRAEIAARARWHLLAEKRDDGAGVRSDLRDLPPTERTAEIARLMSGRTTPAAIARAAELLAEGRAEVPRKRRRAG